MALGLLGIGLWGCSPPPTQVLQGYVEGEYVYLSAPVSGTLLTLAVERGTEVLAGQPTFGLDPEPEATAVREAEHRVAQAEARWLDLTKGMRPSEMAVLEAHLASARADAELAQRELDRFTQLKQERVISPEEMDRVRVRRDRAVASVAGLEADLETARLGARSDQVAAARSELEALNAALARVRWAVEQKRQVAPTNGVVDDTLYRVGEWVAAGRPVVSLLPPGNVKVRFFVPEPQLGQVQVGQGVVVTVAGRRAPIKARVSFIAAEPEYTPPVIYSRENRSRLVYMVEARVSAGDSVGLHPGQPVEVQLEP